MPFHPLKEEGEEFPEINMDAQDFTQQTQNHNKEMFKMIKKLTNRVESLESHFNSHRSRYDKNKEHGNSQIQPDPETNIVGFQEGCVNSEFKMQEIHRYTASTAEGMISGNSILEHTSFSLLRIQYLKKLVSFFLEISSI